MKIPVADYLMSCNRKIIQSFMAVHFPLFYLTDVYALEFAESFLPVFTQYKLISN